MIDILPVRYFLAAPVQYRDASAASAYETFFTEA